MGVGRRVETNSEKSSFRLLDVRSPKAYTHTLEGKRTRSLLNQTGFELRNIRPFSVRRPKILLFLKHDHRVGLQVFHVDAAALGHDVRMLADHQPAHVREEKPAGRVVRVGVRVGELVMDSVVADPFVYVILERQRLERSQQ